MAHVNFKALSSGGYCLIDASSLSALADGIGTLRARLNPALAREIVGGDDWAHLREALEIVERWVVSGDMVVDCVAMASLQDHHIGRSYFWPDDTGAIAMLRRVSVLDSSDDETLEARVLSSLTKPVDALNDKRLAALQQAGGELEIATTFIPAEEAISAAHAAGQTSEALREAHPEVKWGTFGFGHDKRYGEVLQDAYDDVYLLARSHLGIERTLYYYEVASAAHIPLALHPNRRVESDLIGKACIDAYASAKAVLARSFEEPVRKELELLGQQVSARIPGLVTRIVLDAGARGCSLLESARAIRSSEPAKAFRSWLSEIQHGLAGGLPGQLEALGKLRKLNDVGVSWANELNVGSEVTYRRRRLNLSWLPRVGALLSALDSPSVRDPILWRKGYLMFMASWYEQ
jgi:hypothetical protein